MKALCTVHDVPAALAGVRTLAARPDLGDAAAEVAVWRADLEMTHGTVAAAGGQAEVRRALDRGLPEADAHHARGLLAAATPDAIAHFRRAVEADPSHPRANGMLCVLLAASGHFAEARDRIARAEALFPDEHAPPDAAWRALGVWEGAAPDDPRMPWYRARLLLTVGANGRAIRIADDPARAADDNHWPGLRKLAADQLRKQVERLPELRGVGK